MLNAADFLHDEKVWPGLRDLSAEGQSSQALLPAEHRLPETAQGVPKTVRDWSVIYRARLYHTQITRKYYAYRSGSLFLLLLHDDDVLVGRHCDQPFLVARHNYITT